MARVKLFLRIGENERSYKVAATVKPSNAPLTSASGYLLPTVAFAVMLEIPDKAFKQAEQVIAEIRIPEKDLEICAEVTEVES